MVNPEAQRVVAALGLERLPHEGGFFRATWRSAAGSAIYFLLTADDFSALHRLRTDEVWHFYAGDAVEHVQLGSSAGSTPVRHTRLGPNVIVGDTPQLVVPAGLWQGARLATPVRSGWALLGCTLAPPWDESQFELGARDALLRTFPEHATIVQALTR
ncbi:MAG: cupin domain-containing protein [Opitutaceae bacterium]